jgi:hypothetical protein
VTENNEIFAQISTQIMNSLARTFPVACASDEFYFFPHIAGYETTTAPWDDFSAESVRGIVQEISDSLSDLNNITIPDDNDIRAEKNMLVLFLNNLSDQLNELALWKRQPSFYLTLMNAGLAQALNHDNNKLLQERLRGIPEFLNQAVQNIEVVPFHWQEISLSMTEDCKHFLDLLSAHNRNNELSLQAVKHLEDKIKRLPQETEMNIHSDLLERIYSNHLASGLKISEISNILKDETSEMLQIMIAEGEKILKNPVKNSIIPEALINRVYEKINFKSSKKEDPVKMFRNEIDQIRMHLTDSGILEDEPEKFIPVMVEEMPQYFRAIRSASSYSIYPKYPPANGTFYVLTTSGYGVPSENLDEYRMLTAHETYPGHHLLDSSRLALKNIIRRSLEFPLFYEGWACFAEMLLSYTGYFTNPADRFILAKRRYWRAVRGQVDLGLQTKKLDLESAANILQKAGIPFNRAIASAKIYTLNPGYQTCYTVGIRRFLDIYDRYGKEDLRKFVMTILINGEVLFPDLEKLFNGLQIKRIN